MFDVIHHGHDPDFWFLHFFAGLAQGATDGRNCFMISTDIQRTELDTGVTECLDQWRSPRIG